ncbi:twin-arginine translocation signal domain-containing protein [Streptomyces sp. NPDC002599]|uniref:twin-arginine translocation signal domain-containing protein n=1 Tax=Streptomyces sp. NPDC002599 TaxID=3154421 RepID=UPI0033178462
MNRRNFLTAATGTAAAVAPFVGAPPQVGTSDVIRLRSGLDALMTFDRSRGGHEDLERAALSGAAEALEKQKFGATQRIRQRSSQLVSAPSRGRVRLSDPSIMA